MAEKTGQKATGRKLTKEQKGQVLQLALRGVSVGEIARQMDIDVLRVTGTVRSAKNTGILPPDPAPIPPAPSVVPARAPPAQAVKHLIERMAPHHDGLVGEHTKEPSDNDIGQMYGHGSYRISKQVPGRIPEYRELNISQAFGEPRWPRDMSQSQALQRPAWLTNDQKDRVIQLARQGVLWGEIARQMGIDAGRVHGTIIAAINTMLRGVLDSRPSRVVHLNT